MQSDYPANLTGKVALIQRGTCNFGDKSGLARKAGAVGAIMYNNGPGPVSAAVSLGINQSPNGPPVPTVGITRELGEQLIQAIIGKGAVYNAQIYVKTDIQNVTT